MTAPSPRHPTTEEIIEEFRLYLRDDMMLSDDESIDQITESTTLSGFFNLTDEEAKSCWPIYYEKFGISAEEMAKYDHVGNTPLLEVARDMAKHLEVPPIVPVTILGKPCEAAGLFLDIKRALVSKGEDERAIGPSTYMAPFIRRHPKLFARFRWYAPGRVPNINVTNYLFTIGCVILSLGSLMFIAELFSSKRFAVEIYNYIIFSFLSVAIVAMTISLCFRNKFERVAGNQLTDFRSLVHTILGREVTKNLKQTSSQKRNHTHTYDRNSQ